MSTAYYSDSDIDSFVKRVTAPEAGYAQNAANGAAQILDKRPSAYKRFGVYWWGLKALMKKYVHNGTWYCGPFNDSVMQTRADHGSEFRNAIAAWVYFENHPLEDAKAQWEDDAGVIHPYTLMDTDAPA